MVTVLSSSDIAQLVRAAFRDLDRRQLAVFAKHSPTERLVMMFDLCRFAQQMIIASERQRDPNISEEELARRVKARIELSHGA